MDSVCKTPPYDGNLLYSNKYWSMDKLIFIFCYISMLLIGADKWGVNIGVNLRVDQLFLCILVILLEFRGAYRITFNKDIILFGFFSAISVIFAFNVLRGFVFYFSIVYNIFLVFYAFESFVRAYGIEKLIKIFRYSVFTQFVILIIQFLLKVLLNFEFSFLPAYGEYMGIPRFNLWFYEPSYLATFLVFWIFISAYEFIIESKITYLKDLLMGLCMILISTSSSGFIGVGICFVIIFFSWFCKGITTKKLIFLLTIILLIIAFIIVFNSIFNVFIGRLFSGNLDEASGGRISAWVETFEVFMEHPLFGVGPGNYGLYLFDDTSIVPSNVTLELMATLGIFATLSFYAISIRLFIKCRKIKQKNKNNETLITYVLCIALFVFTIVLQINQGYLRLYHWMFMGIISGCYKYCLKNKKI